MFGSSAIPFYLVVVNLYLFFLLLFDRHQERKESWRVPDWHFLVLGVVGGGFGGLAGQVFLDHKKEKRRFTLIFQIGAVLAVVMFISTLNLK